MMRTLSIEIPDDVYDFLQNYSDQSGKSVESLAVEVIENSLALLDAARAQEKIRASQEKWKKERGWESYGHSKTVSHSIR